MLAAGSLRPVKTTRPFLLVSCGVFLAGLLLVAATRLYADATGAQLARALVPAETRWAAWQELARRANAKAGDGEERIVVEEGAEPEVIVCPQGEGRGPVYVVLHRFLTSTSDSASGYPVARPAELFPPLPVAPDAPVAPSHPPLERRSDLVIVAFDARGEEVKPFGGDNVLSDGVLADFTGEGRIARGEGTNLGVEGVETAQVLQVMPVEAAGARPLLEVLYNWGDEAGWGYEFAPRVGDEGTVEVRFGPRLDPASARIDPWVTYHWDRARRAFIGPAGGAPGDHFLRLPEGQDTSAAVENLRGKLPFFVGGAPSSAPAGEVRELVTAPEPPAPPSPARPATPPAERPPLPVSFLAGLSDEALLRFFDDRRDPEAVAADEARTARQRRAAELSLPANFWDGPPSEVALALVELNRSPEHRARYRLAVDARGGVAPPREGALLFDTGSSRCYIAADGTYFLPFGPGDEPAHLLSLRTTGAGVVFYNAAASQPSYDLRRCQLSAAAARQFAAVLWWLDRVRSRARPTPLGKRWEMERISSTADGHGTFQLVPGPATGAPPLRLSDTLWSGGWTEGSPNAVVERAKGDYEPATALNITWHLFDEAIPARLGAEWSRFGLHEGTAYETSDQTPRYTPGELARLHDLAARVLALSPREQGQVSYGLSGGVAQMVGQLGLADLAPALRDLASRLPAAPPERAGRTAETVSREMNEASPYEGGKERWPYDSPERKAADARHDKLSAELAGITDGTDEPGAAENLRAMVAAALDQLARTTDPAALTTAAADPEAPRATWALQQLQRLGETDRAADVLAGWIARAQDGTARQVFAALAKLAPGRAKRLAEALPADKPAHPLYVPAFALLSKAGAPVPQEETRRRALVGIVLDPARPYTDRTEAIRALVPDDAPARYPDPAIDAALRRLFDEPALATRDGRVDDYLLLVAAQALVQRPRQDGDFGRLLARTPSGQYFSGNLLEPLAQLVPPGGGEEARQLEAFLRTQLADRTNLQVNELLQTAWLAGLRGLRPEMRLLATAGPREEENAPARTVGGEPTPLTGERFHLARQVAALWEDEAPPAARARALIAFGACHGVAYDGPWRDRFSAELARLAPLLSAADRPALAAFLDLAARPTPPPPGTAQPASDADREAREEEAQRSVKLRALVTTILGL